MLLSSAPLRDDTPRKSNPIIRWIFRIVMTVVVLFVLLMVAMHALNGTGDAQRGGIEGILNDVFNGQTHIKEFKYFSAIPYVGVEMENILVVDELHDSKMLMNLDYIAFNTGLKNVLFRTPVFRYFEIRNFYAAPNTLAPKAIIFDHIKPIKGEKHLGVKGQYSKLPFDLKAEAVPLIEGQEDLSYGFRLDKKIKVFGTIDTLNVAFTLAHEYGKFQMKDISIKQGDKELLNGSFSYAHGGNIAADLNIDKMMARVDVNYSPAENAESKDKLSGDVTVKNLDLNMIGDKAGSIQMIIEAANVISGLLNAPVDAIYAKADEKAKVETMLPALPDSDVNIKFVDLKLQEAVLGDITLPFSARENTLGFNKINGTLNGGKVSGNLTLKESRGETPQIALSQDIQINQWNFGQLVTDLKLNHSDITGRMNIKTDLKAESPDLAQIKDTLGGSASFIISDASMKSGIADKLLSGLFTALMPSLEKEQKTEINCVIGHFAVENGVANIDTLFADTARLQLVGSGNINIAKDKYDMKLTPQAKQTTLLDIAPAIRVGGPLNKPSFGADTLSLGTKIGGLILSAANPVLLAATLTDFGLSEEHSCNQFAPKGEKAAPVKAEEKD